MTDDERFTDKEVREILARAAQDPESKALTRGDGLSLRDLKTIGAEVGIDPSRVEEAARAVKGPGAPSTRFFGLPPAPVFERTVNGELGTPEMSEALSVIRRKMGKHGDVQEVLGSVEWSHRGESGERSVTLSSQDGRTTVRGTANLTNVATVTYTLGGAAGLTLGLAPLVTFLRDGNTLGLLLLLTLVPVVFLILRTVVHWAAEKEADKLEQVVNEVAQLAERSEGA